MSDWFSEPANWIFLIVGLGVAAAGFRVVTSRNVVHAALYLVGTLAGTAVLFLLLSAEFVAWVLVLVYIGAVIVLFLFGIMITRAPIGYDATLDNNRRGVAAVVSGALFLLMSWASIDFFGSEPLQDIGQGTPTELLGESILGRFVLPFEIVSFVLLAALVGGITVARKDATPAEAEEQV
ncbi:MAG: NADH-quinone oxidoreductase subunit J [Acidimicrobiia bacterium]|nr:NADH-quinone oxidoreductase subunit J [Acidimicrobiia bacterium]